ncbi:MAG: ABC transporter ATP-binding protein [Halovenus sp.]
MLDVTSLHKRYDDFEFGPVDLGVETEVLSVLGPSGSGKTTFLSLIAGIVHPDAGTVSLNGRSLGSLPIEDRQTGLVFQDGALFPHMTAYENIDYAATDPGRVEELASLLELSDVLEKRPPRLSGGEKQRVALARTLAADPEALLLDEPLSSLDAPIRRRLRGELHTLLTSLEIPVVYVTHDQRTAATLGDRLAIFRDGELEQVGSPSRVFGQPATEFVARFTGNENLFEATVSASPDPLIRIGDLSLQVSTNGVTESVVTACIHPSRVRLYGPDETPETPTQNVFSGTIAQCLNEGNGYRLEIALGNSQLTMTATVQPATFDRVATGVGSNIRIAIPSDAVHLIP